MTELNEETTMQKEPAVQEEQRRHNMSVFVIAVVLLSIFIIILTIAIKSRKSDNASENANGNIEQSGTVEETSWANNIDIVDHIISTADSYSGDLKKQYEILLGGILLSNNDSDVLLKFEEVGFQLANQYYETGEYSKCMAVYEDMMEYLPKSIFESSHYADLQDSVEVGADANDTSTVTNNATADPALIEERRAEIESANGYGYSRGQLMPDFTMYDLDGNKVQLSDFLGKAVYVNLFATWCPYCFYEIPDMMEVQDEYANDITFIMIDLEETAKEVKSYKETYGIDNIDMYTVPEFQIGSYSPEGIPVSFVLDKYGAIANMTEGMTDKDWMERAVRRTME